MGHIKDSRSTRRSYNQMPRIPGIPGQSSQYQFHRKPQHQQAEIRRLQRQNKGLKKQLGAVQKQLGAVQKQLAREQDTTSMQEGILSTYRGSKKFEPDYDAEYARQIGIEYEIVQAWRKDQDTENGGQRRSLGQIRELHHDRHRGIPGWYMPYVRSKAASGARI